MNNIKAKVYDYKSYRTGEQKEMLICEKNIYIEYNFDKCIIDTGFSERISEEIYNELYNKHGTNSFDVLIEFDKYKQTFMFFTNCKIEKHTYDEPYYTIFTDDKEIDKKIAEILRGDKYIKL